jgi:RNA polymerase sigma-70 factor (ECF subfamily)
LLQNRVKWTGAPPISLAVGLGSSYAARSAGNLSLRDGVELAVVHPPLQSESVLLARACGGDLDAYEQLVRLHQQLAFRTALVLARNAADAEEAAQDAFVKAWRALRRFDRSRPFRPWLLAIVANEARNRRRAAGRREALVLRAAAASAGPADAGAPSPELVLLVAERDGALAAALGRLAERDRQVIACRYLLELTEAETAAALGCRVGTVKSRLSRALERLRAQAGTEVLHG